MSEPNDPVQVELMLNQFRRLVRDIQRGLITRNTFQPWQIELLLDIEACHLDWRLRPEILRRYEKAVERQLEMGGGTPMKLSEFLQLRAKRNESSTGP
jgi:hypothetical protein